MSTLLQPCFGWRSNIGVVHASMEGSCAAFCALHLAALHRLGLGHL